MFHPNASTHCGGHHNLLDEGIRSHLWLCDDPDFVFKRFGNFLFKRLVNRIDDTQWGQRPSRWFRRRRRFRWRPRWRLRWSCARREQRRANQKYRRGECGPNLSVHWDLSCGFSLDSAKEIDALIARPSGVVAAIRRSSKSGSPSSIRCSVARRTRPIGNWLPSTRE